MSEIPALLSPILCFHPMWAEVASSSLPCTYCSLSILPPSCWRNKGPGASGQSGPRAYSGEGRLGMGWRGKSKCWNSFAASCRRMRVLRVRPQPFPARKVVGTLLGMKRPVLIASATEGVGRRGPSREYLRAGKGLEEGQCWVGRKSDKENESSEKSIFLGSCEN